MVSVAASGSFTITDLDTELTVYDTTVAGVYVYNIALGTLQPHSATSETLELRALQPLQGSATVLSENYRALFQGGLNATGSTGPFAASPPLSAPYGFRGTIKHTASATGRTFVYRVDLLG